MGSTESACPRGLRNADAISTLVVYKVLPERCIGCGVCISTCTTAAVQLVRRPDSEQDTPPADLVDWTMKRAATRGVELKLD